MISNGHKIFCDSFDSNSTLFNRPDIIAIRKYVLYSFYVVIPFYLQAVFYICTTLCVD